MPASEQLAPAQHEDFDEVESTYQNSYPDDEEIRQYALELRRQVQEALNNAGLAPNYETQEGPLDVLRNTGQGELIELADKADIAYADTRAMENFRQLEREATAALQAAGTQAMLKERDTQALERIGKGLLAVQLDAAKDSAKAAMDRFYAREMDNYRVDDENTQLYEEHRERADSLEVARERLAAAENDGTVQQLEMDRLKASVEKAEAHVEKGLDYDQFVTQDNVRALTAIARREAEAAGKKIVLDDNNKTE